VFTGIIQARGRIASLQRRGGDVRLSVESTGLPFATYAVGESIAVNGVCLTAVELREDGFDTDVSLETLDVTNLGHLNIGDYVNLEPSIALGQRLGGHLVSGHVDCVGKIAGRESDARSIRFTVEVPGEYLRYIAKKGSVAVDGVSLTVNAVAGATFDVNVIPHTAGATTFGEYAAGTEVNVEVDLLARYIERLLVTDEVGLTMDFLREHGYGK
jgi:riboflavin synthase